MNVTTILTHQIKFKTLFLLLVVGLFSCNERNTDKPVQAIAEEETSTLNLSGQVYFYAPELDATTCEAFGECDCCSGSFLFLNDNDFLTMNVCEANEWYCKGTYKIVNDNVVLTYDSLMVEKNYNWEMVTDTTGTVTTEYFIETSKTNAPISILTRIVCEKNICFKTDDEQITYATLDKNQKLTDLIKQVKDGGIWDKLEMK